MAEFRVFCITILKISFRFEEHGDDDDSPNGENSSDELAVGGRMAYRLFAYIVGKGLASYQQKIQKQLSSE